MNITIPDCATVHEIIFASPEQEYTITAEKDADATYFFIFTASATVQVTINLQGPGATVRVYGIYFLHDNHQVEMVTRQEHHTPHATSTVLIKGVLNGTASIRHKGLILIQKEATGSVAYQHNKNIMLSQDARAWAQPSLEVLTHEVHCAHGSATGQLDEDQLYYMQARGIGPKEAKTLLLKGFFADILEKIEDPTVGDVISKKIHEQIW